MVIRRGEVLGLVGESASGKTTVGTSLLDYQRRGAKIAGGSVEIDGRDILAMDPKALRGVRGGQDQLRAPGLFRCAQPGASDRHAAHGDPRGARLRLLASGPRGATDPDDGRGAAAVRQGVPAAVPAPAVRRPAAARRHRHGVRQPAGGHRPRRADHRPGRDHAGARAGHGPRPHQVVRGRGALHHPRPRRGLQPRRPHRRHVRREGGRDRHARRAVQRRPPPVHAQAAGLHPRHHRGARPARHPRLGASSGTAASGLCVHSALRLGGGQVQRGVPAGRGREPRPSRALLALQGGRRAGGWARHPAARQVALGSAGDKENAGHQRA